MPPTSIPKIFMAGGAVGFTYYLVMRQYWFPNPRAMKTAGVQNIEARHTAGGGAPNSTPAMASERGGSQNAESRQAGGHRGPDSEEYNKSINDQKSEPGVWPQKFYEQQYSNPKGK